ncbi:MAG: hypothetical protein WA118_14445 [Carboxydocellales bacterium]
MKVTFPYMGTSHIAFKHLVNNLGHQALVPPPPSKRTLTYGTQHAPEFACIPFKVILGSYIEALELGAELIITSGGNGPCRAGIYGMLHERILKSLGYKFEMIVFESIFQEPFSFLKKVRRMLKTGGTSWLNFVKVYRESWAKLCALDEIEILANKVRPYEQNRGETTKVFKQCVEMIDLAQTRAEIAKAKSSTIQLMKGLPQDQSRKPLKIGIIGEIYVLLEPFINLDVERTLGEMGVYANRSIYLTDWTRENTTSKKIDAKTAAQPYLAQLIGGHGINSVGETVLYAQEGYDGVIQLAPFTCIPEIVVKSLMPKISRELGIPVLTVFLDEQTGKAGLQTRLEAFVDLLEQKRRWKEEGTGWTAI